MPDWWRELVAIPNAGDPKGLACKICASLEVSQVGYKAFKDPGDYTVPPAPKCVQRKMFLSVTNSHLALPILLAETTAEDRGICPSPSVLGCEGQTTGV